MTKNTKTIATKADIIKEYKELGAQIKQLRVDHLKDIEDLIKKYKADKKALKAKRAKLLAKLAVEDKVEAKAA